MMSGMVSKTTIVEERPGFEAIARELERPLRRYLERYVGEPSVADDLLQETLIRISRGLASFAGRSSHKTWAFAIASRVAADHFRDPARRRKIVELDEVDEPVDPGPAVDERLIAGQMNDCVRGVIDSLPEAYRAALILHDLEGLTARRTAEIIDCSLATAKIRIHRARARLRQALEDQCDFYRDQDDVFRCDQKV
jgi:RNA polymerase sigma-70 factor (ECF subfamily)